MFRNDYIYRLIQVSGKITAWEANRFVFVSDASPELLYILGGDVSCLS